MSTITDKHRETGNKIADAIINELRKHLPDNGSRAEFVTLRRNLIGTLAVSLPDHTALLSDVAQQLEKLAEECPPIQARKCSELAKRIRQLGEIKPDDSHERLASE